MKKTFNHFLNYKKVKTILMNFLNMLISEFIKHKSNIINKFRLKLFQEDFLYKK